MDTGPHSFTSLGCSNDLALKWTNYVSSFIKGNFGMPYHAFDMNFAFDGHYTGARNNVRQSKRKYQGEILLCLSTVRNLQRQVLLSQYALTQTPWQATLGRNIPKHGKTTQHKTHSQQAPQQHPPSVRFFFLALFLTEFQPLHSHATLTAGVRGFRAHLQIRGKLWRTTLKTTPYALLSDLFWKNTNENGTGFAGTK